MMAEGHGNSYPPHGIASAAKWLGINDGDRFEYCNAMMSDPQEIHAQMVEQFGPDSKAAKIQFQTGDFLSDADPNRQGKMIRLDYSLSNTRPYSRYYLLQGMKGCFDSRSGLYVQGDSPLQILIQVGPGRQVPRRSIAIRGGPRTPRRRRRRAGTAAWTTSASAISSTWSATTASPGSIATTPRLTTC